MKLLLTKQDILRVQKECRDSMKQLAKLYPGAFDRNGKPLVATTPPLYQ